MKYSPELLEVNLRHEVVPGAEELSGLEVEPSKVKTQLQHAITSGKKRGQSRGAEEVRQSWNRRNQANSALLREHTGSNQAHIG